MLRVFVGLFGLGLLSACASLSESECLSADWYQIGYEDGTNGADYNRFARHIKACEKHGVVPQQTPWKEGREKGLRLFCVPERAYNVGRSGNSFPRVCTAKESIAMRPAFDWGREYYLLTEEIDELENDIISRNNELMELADPDDPLFDIYAEYNANDYRRIRRLEWRRDRYDRWPAQRAGDRFFLSVDIN